MTTEVTSNVQTFDDMSNEEYHAHPALGSTSLKTLAGPGGPAKWKYDQENPIGYKQEFAFGTAAHSLILENDESKIHIIKAKNPRGETATDFRTKKAQAERDEAIAAGKEPLLQYEWDQIRWIRDRIMEHPLVENALTDHVAEQSIFWERDEVELKVRPDALKISDRGGLILDLKTLADANPSRFGKSAYDFGYYISAAHYEEGVYQLTGERLPFVFINVEKKPPYLVSIIELEEEALDYGRYMIDRAIRIYKECKASDTWPGYPLFTGGVGLPFWATRDLDDLLDGENE